MRGAMLAALAALCADRADAVPRIVSTNPCADAVLVAVADPRSIAAISHYSHDPRASSIPIETARRYPASRGTAEALVALRPSLVIGDTLMAPATVQALARLGIPLIRLPVPESLAESRTQVMVVANAAGRPKHGAALNARIDAAVAAARIERLPRLTALIWQGGGLVLGTGTLADELLRLTGFANHAPAYGFGKWGVLPLERLVADPPQVLLVGGDADGAASAGDRLFSHPAVTTLEKRIAVRPLPSRLLRCGGPSIIPAVRHMAAQRRLLEKMK